MLKINYIILLFLLSSCRLYDKDERLLVTHKKSNGKHIAVYYVAVGATASDVIQVRLENHNKPLFVIKKNYLKESEIINDTILRLIVGDTGYYRQPKYFDTVFVNLNTTLIE